MMNVSNRLPLLFVRHRMNRLVVVGVLSVAGVLSGVIPQVAPSTIGLSTTSVAIAQSPDAQISNYARAALRIEQLRQRMYTDAKAKLGGNVPPNVCSQPEPPASVRDICTNFMQQTRDIIRQNNLSVSQFNELTRRKDSDPAFQQQLQEELLRLQRSAP